MCLPDAAPGPSSPPPPPPPYPTLRSHLPLESSSLRFPLFRGAEQVGGLWHGVRQLVWGLRLIYQRRPDPKPTHSPLPTHPIIHSLHQPPTTSTSSNSHLPPSALPAELDRHTETLEWARHACRMPHSSRDWPGLPWPLRMLLAESWMSAAPGCRTVAEQLKGSGPLYLLLASQGGRGTQSATETWQAGHTMGKLHGHPKQTPGGTSKMG